MKIIKGLIPYVLILVAVILIRIYVVTPAFVSGTSMSPTLKDNDLVLLKKFDKTYKRFDIVVVRLPEENLIKRVIGLPGETIRYKDNMLYINDRVIEDTYAYGITGNFQEVVLKEDEYFLMGDNREVSLDSRIIGKIKKDEIEGKVGIIIYPFSKIGKAK